MRKYSEYLMATNDSMNKLHYSDKSSARSFENSMLPDEKHNQTFGIKCCQTKGMTGLLKLSIARRKDDQTFGIKVREVLPDERYDWTFGIKCCQTKGMTELLELRIKCYQMKSTTRFLELSVARRKIRLDFWN
ncbi:hypothetical protein GLOIN_2v1884393 [Rhizophagus clarus]|uniref:Uncharacterized protein n=1 Tax=Rhizophagus clarus TaxID=94130 RepID=A0A8H3KXB6_9GLOM|nr:hypothetical protein GLOIN_2v1884393 [Rhizophagus clarus]